MKKIVAAVAFLAWAGLAAAGEYHAYDTLKCSQCHTMHASRSHAFQSASPSVLPTPGVGNEKLLVGASVNETCLSCHDSGGGHDVFGAATFGRSGGALNAVGGAIGAHTVGVAADGTAYAEFMGHTLGARLAPPGFDGDPTIWTASTASEFECSDCHAVHGSTSYRNLANTHARTPLKDPNTVVSYQTGGTFDPAYDVNLTQKSMATKDISFGIGGAANYKGNATTPTNNMNAVCASCHGNFHGVANTGVSPAFIRHPTSGVSMKASGAIASAPFDLVRPAFNIADKSTFEPACLTCHKGHGNARGFGLIYPGVVEATDYGAKATGASVLNYEEGDAVKGTSSSFPIRNLCITCHSQGRTKR
jgi:hypothetical protein